jgi:sulfur carrier protein ThiS
MSHKITTNPEIRIRVAREDDLTAVTRVAGRDTSQPPAWPILVAEVGSEIRAAISLTDGEVVADPFHRTAELVEMLRIRARGAAARLNGDVVRFERQPRERLALRSAA